MRRTPLLSDDRVYGPKNDKGYYPDQMRGDAVRSFYEELIDRGELVPRQEINRDVRVKIGCGDQPLKHIQVTATHYAWKKIDRAEYDYLVRTGAFVVTE